MRVFLDTNIIIDFIELTRKNHKKADRLIGFLSDRDIETAISEDMITTIFYISKNKKKVSEFLKSIIGKWLIFPYGKNVISEAIGLAYNDSLDLEDALQCICARENSCDYFITSDKKFIKCVIDIVTYDEFFEIVKL
jgi:predicted nucleic acid-binding protein